MDMDEVGSSERLVSTCQTTRYQNPENYNLNYFVNEYGWSGGKISFVNDLASGES
jgi:hypothetical protein